MQYLLEMSCPHCGALQKKDFQDILSTTMGCNLCHMAFSLQYFQASLEAEQFTHLQQSLRAKAQNYYGSILEIKDEDIRRYSQWIVDHLQETPDGLLVKALHTRVPSPDRCRESLNMLVNTERVAWHGSAGNDSAKLKE